MAMWRYTTLTAYLAWTHTFEDHVNANLHPQQPKDKPISTFLPTEGYLEGKRSGSKWLGLKPQVSTHRA